MTMVGGFSVPEGWRPQGGRIAAKPYGGGLGVDETEMCMGSQEFDVESDALRRYAKALGHAAGRLESLERRTQGLGLEGSVFGKLPDAEVLREDYNAQLTESGDDLGNGAEMLRSFAANLNESADDYDATDRDAVSGFGGGL
ncbi:WXG100 family type VII secretion target [Streptomyces sp. NPDC048639]|uniref:WXG100 family type VII secretion target n=1 Tax=Streptomyces sp. NPDC048639 TaxID=3365581 RepID=UPI0037178FF1